MAKRASRGVRSGRRLQVPFNLEYVTKLVGDERAKAPGASQGPQYTFNTEVRLLYQLCVGSCAYVHMGT